MTRAAAGAGCMRTAEPGATVLTAVAVMNGCAWLAGWLNAGCIAVGSTRQVAVLTWTVRGGSAIEGGG
jgi:hypothetical protein